MQKYEFLLHHRHRHAVTHEIMRSRHRRSAVGAVVGFARAMCLLSSITTVETMPVMGAAFLRDVLGPPLQDHEMDQQSSRTTDSASSLLSVQHRGVAGGGGGRRRDYVCMRVKNSRRRRRRLRRRCMCMHARTQTCARSGCYRNAAGTGLAGSE